MEEKIILDNSIDQYIRLKEDITHDPQLKMRVMSERNQSFYQEFIAYNDKHIRYYYAEYRLFFSSLGIPFLKVKESSSFKITKPSFKITDYNINWKSKHHVISKINELLNVEWFNNFINTPNYRHLEINMFYKKNILTQVWKKNITNPEQLLKYFIKTNLHVKNITWKNVRNYFTNTMNTYGLFDYSLIRIIDQWVINPNLFIQKLLDNVNNMSLLLDYKDYLLQLVVLEQHSNVGKWSYKRFIKEHEKNSLLLMKQDLDQADKTLLFSNSINEYLPKAFKCSFINNEYLCLKEGKSMKHCLYTNYWNWIKKLSYFAISINDETVGRYTVGIKTNYQKKFIIDQIKGVSNSSCPRHVYDIFNEWVENNQELLATLQDPNQIEVNVCTEEIDDFFPF